MSDDERKLFIDEGWKAQVQREKEEATRKAVEAPSTADEAGAPGTHAPTAEMDPSDEMLPPSFSALLGMLVPQTLLALGLLQQQPGQQVYVDLEQALYLIGILEVLQVKTKGNLTEQETLELTESLTELKRVFALRAQQVEQAALQQAGIDPRQLKGGLQ